MATALVPKGAELSGVQKQRKGGGAKGGHTAGDVSHESLLVLLGISNTF